MAHKRISESWATRGLKEANVQFEIGEAEQTFFTGIATRVISIN
jgi:hypothetical protein